MLLWSVRRHRHRSAVNKVNHFWISSSDSLIQVTDVVWLSLLWHRKDCRVSLSLSLSLSGLCYSLMFSRSHIMPITVSRTVCGWWAGGPSTLYVWKLAGLAAMLVGWWVSQSVGRMSRQADKIRKKVRKKKHTRGEAQKWEHTPRTYTSINVDYTLTMNNFQMPLGTYCFFLIVVFLGGS